MYKSKSDRRTLKYRCLQDRSDLLKGKRYRYINRGGNVLGVAHCDFVGCNREKRFHQYGRFAHSTTLDDRLGVYIILDVLPQMGIVTDVLLTDDEEVGRSTARLFAKHRKDDAKQYNWIFSFDRHGAGAVTYDFDSMEGFAEHYFGKLHWGTFSDISCLDGLGCAGINVGTGYFNEHTVRSFADLQSTQKQVNRFATMFHEMEGIHIPHEKVEKPVFNSHFWPGWNSDATEPCRKWNAMLNSWERVDPSRIDYDVFNYHTESELLAMGIDLGPDVQVLGDVQDVDDVADVVIDLDNEDDDLAQEIYDAEQIREAMLWDKAGYLERRISYRMKDRP